MEELTFFCCSSALIAGLATFFWARWSSRGVRLFSAVWMGPSVALFSALVFHSGTFIYQGLRGVKALHLAAPSTSWGLLHWLQYSCISTIIPLVLAIVLLITAVVVTGVGPHHAVSSLGGLDTFVGGSWLPDAFGCIALGSLILGPVPYGLFFGACGFVLGLISRVFDRSVMILQDPLALLLMTILVWVASMGSALVRSAPRQPGKE